MKEVEKIMKLIAPKANQLYIAMGSKYGYRACFAQDNNGEMWIFDRNGNHNDIINGNTVHELMEGYFLVCEHLDFLNKNNSKIKKMKNTCVNCEHFKESNWFSNRYYCEDPKRPLNPVYGGDSMRGGIETTKESSCSLFLNKLKEED